MPSRVRSLLLASITTLAGASTTLAGGTIASGDATLQLVGNPVFGINNGDANALFTPLSSGGFDALFQFGWYYRTPNNNQNRLFSSLDTPTESYVGNVATATYTNAGPGSAGFERFDATIRVYLFDGVDPNQGIIEQRVVFRAAPANTGPVTYQVFHLEDPDLSATPFDDEGSLISASYVRLRVTDALNADTIDSYALGATRYEYASGTSLRAKLGSGAASLSNTVGPVFGDVALAYQWTLTLAPGETRVLTTKMGLNRSACRTDFDNDGVRAPADIFAFLNAYFAGDRRADWTLDDTLAPADIFAYLNSYFAGC